MATNRFVESLKNRISRIRERILIIENQIFLRSLASSKHPSDGPEYQNLMNQISLLESQKNALESQENELEVELILLVHSLPPVEPEARGEKRKENEINDNNTSPQKRGKYEAKDYNFNKKYNFYQNIPPNRIGTQNLLADFVGNSLSKIEITVQPITYESLVYLDKIHKLIRDRFKGFFDPQVEMVCEKIFICDSYPSKSVTLLDLIKPTKASQKSKIFERIVELLNEKKLNISTRQDTCKSTLPITNPCKQKPSYELHNNTLYILFHAEVNDENWKKVNHFKIFLGDEYSVDTTLISKSHCCLIKNIKNDEDILTKLEKHIKDNTSNVSEKDTSTSDFLSEIIENLRNSTPINELKR